MPDILQQLRKHSLTVTGILCVSFVCLYTQALTFYMYLTFAQLLFVPAVFQRIVQMTRWQFGAILIGQFSVTMLACTSITPFVFSLLYSISTACIAFTAIQRILQRGFTAIEEWWIDIGFLYIFIGGLWFFAFTNAINVGFSPIITWLTAIHFHYSGFLLCVTLGLLGRVITHRLYTICASLLVAGPMIVAVSITFSPYLEVAGTIIYVVSIFIVTVFVMIRALKGMQRLFLTIAFSTICFTIIWSLLYAIGRATNITTVSIPDMLEFHGFFNCFGFGLFIALCWSFGVPNTRVQIPQFPKSQLTGQPCYDGAAHDALIDDMRIFQIHHLPKLTHFYEHTTDYNVYARVYWAKWFKPLAFIYTKISQKIGQINLPYSNERILMSGRIQSVDTALDRRQKPRVWIRSANDETIFHAIYSTHVTNDIAYLNIALPLPYSVMHGILHVSANDETLFLTSDAAGDSGTYLTWRNNTMKLPLHEYFSLHMQHETLRATHTMRLFHMKFLTIHYELEKK